VVENATLAINVRIKNRQFPDPPRLIFQRIALLITYNTTLSPLLDKHAHIITKHR